MRILYIASVRIPNEKASGLAIMRQCEAFAKAGHEVTLLRPYRINSIADDAFTFYGIEPCFTIRTMWSFDVITLGKFGFFVMRLWQMFYTFFYVSIHAKDVDVFYTRDPWMAIFPTYGGLSKKIVLEVHKTYTSRLIDNALSRAWKVIFITHGLQKHYIYKTKRTDYLVEPSGVNLAQFNTVCTQYEARIKHRLPLDKVIIGFIGKYRTMGEEKGVDDLVTVFSQIARSHQNTHLLLVGLEPEEQSYVRGLARRVGVSEPRYTLLPLEQKNFASYVQAADILVMNYPDTEHYRAFMSPTKLFAYMASGKRVIATDLPSVREIVNEHMVYFAHPSDLISLKKALSQALCASDSEISQRGERCRKHVATFSWEARSARILASLESWVN